MQLLHCSGNEIHLFAGSVVTIGNFDGVHRGHAELLHQLKERSVRLELPSVVVTFEPHPLVVLAPEAAPALITTAVQKAELIEQAGIEYLAVIRFTSEFSKIPAGVFVRTYLCQAFGMRHMIIGHDYAFGRNRSGNFETLSGMGAECGFSIEDLEPVTKDGTIFSSSLARRLISSGDMTAAAAVLGRYHVISGTVIHGREIGATIGFPTANIETENELLPPDGVYAVMVSVAGRLVQGACNIGKNPTFNGMFRTIEVFLLDFSSQLYDSRISVCFVRRLRDVKKFSNTEDLVQAITQDVATTRAVLEMADQGMLKPLSGISRWGEV